ncbi:hypothetical protein EDB80DRAFT_875650 [Ilyonectria destructans]|nr:hypothetical protein EDB80DRAFT_875650 [Ilyonectria destructans]
MPAARAIRIKPAREKFSAKKRAHFDLEEIAAAEEVEDKAALADLAGISNHSYRTFNHAYTGSTTLTISTLLHRAYRASQSWRTLFRVDQLLQGKQPQTVSETQAQGLLNTYKKARFRTRPAAREDGLAAVARGLYNDPELQLRRPCQRDGMLATLGPRLAEQVIVVLATGSGKTLIVMVGAALEGAATTILILPTVALRVWDFLSAGLGGPGAKAFAAEQLGSVFRLDLAGNELQERVLWFYERLVCQADPVALVRIPDIFWDDLVIKLKRFGESTGAEKIPIMVLYGDVDMGMLLE